MSLKMFIGLYLIELDNVRMIEHFHNLNFPIHFL